MNKKEPRPAIPAVEARVLKLLFLIERSMPYPRGPRHTKVIIVHYVIFMWLILLSVTV